MPRVTLLVIHCATKEQAEDMRAKLTQRLQEWKLNVNEEKTRIVYCKDSNRSGGDKPLQFTFLSYTFRPRAAENHQTKEIFTSFLPAISRNARLDLYGDIRQWGLNQRTQETLPAIAAKFSPEIRGWINYFGEFYPTALYGLFNHIDQHLVRWAIRKYKHLHRSRKQGRRWLAGVKSRDPKMFPHWAIRHAE